MKTRNYIYLFILLTQCTRVDTDELIKDGPVLNAVFENGKPPSGIRYFELPLSGETSEKSRAADITIVAEDSSEVVLKYNGSEYYSNENFIFQSDKNYKIQVADHETGTESWANVAIPPAIQVIVQEMETVVISDPGNHAGLVQWASPDPERYSFVLRLENLEAEQVEIDQVPTDQFRNRFSGPQLEPFLSLLKSDFRFYGRHKLTVFIIDRQFEALFFFDASDLRGLLQNGPENVTGGNGFVAGVSSFEIEIFIQN